MCRDAKFFDYANNVRRVFCRLLAFSKLIPHEILAHHWVICNLRRPVRICTTLRDEIYSNYINNFEKSFFMEFLWIFYGISQKGDFLA